MVSWGIYSHRHMNWVMRCKLILELELINPITTRKSISSEWTFKVDIKSLYEIENKLRQLVIKVSKEMKSKLLCGRIITVKIRYYDFETITRQYSMQNATNNHDTIFIIAKELLVKNINKKRPVRLIGIGIKDFQKGEHQLNIFN